MHGVEGEQAHLASMKCSSRRNCNEEVPFSSWYFDSRPQ